jgi:hypothetical protein
MSSYTFGEDRDLSRGSWTRVRNQVGILKLKSTAFIALLCIAAPCTFAAESLDLSDCDVLLGKKDRPEFDRWLSRVHLDAKAGQLYARRAIAGAANNTMACHEEAATGNDSAWKLSVSSKDEKGQDVVGTRTSEGIKDVQQRPAALKALREVIAQSHSVGEFDPGYRTVAAEWVLKYSKILPDLLPQAYEDVAGAYQFDCVLKRSYGKRLREEACADERQLVRQFLPRVSAHQRDAADRRAAAWARTVDPSTSD